jgi:ribonuclease P/MRP protein subunit RPP40
MYIIVDDPATSAATLNKDLDTILEWSRTWLVTFNPSKTETLTFSRKTAKPIHPDLYFDHVLLHPVSSHKHLGLTLSEDCKWNAHVTATVNKAWQRLALLRSFKYLLTRPNLERLYVTFIRPLLEYGDVVWDNSSDYLKSQLESVQIEALRIITGATKYCNLDKLYHESGIEPLVERRRKHKLSLLFKMKNNLVPNYLCNLIPPRVDHRFELRHPQRLPLIPCKTEFYRTSFLPSAIREWNSLPTSIIDQTTIHSFKTSLNAKSNLKSNVLFNIGERRLQMLHTRLRLGCSSLNFDLHRRSLIDSPLCSCGLAETVSHFYLSCPNYIQQRQNLLTNLPCPVTIDNLLLGNEHLSLEQNKQVILIAQQFIAATGRFDPSHNG